MLQALNLLWVNEVGRIALSHISWGEKGNAIVTQTETYGRGYFASATLTSAHNTNTTSLQMLQNRTTSKLSNSLVLRAKLSNSRILRASFSVKTLKICHQPDGFY